MTQQPEGGALEPAAVHTGQPAAGWYPDAQNAALERWWGGNRWTEQVRPRQAPMQHPGQPYAGQPYPQQVVVVQAAQGGRSIGLTTGEHLMHLILTICTLGLWGVVWLLRIVLGRRRIS